MFGKYILRQNTVRKSTAAMVSGTSRTSRQTRTSRKSSRALVARMRPGVRHPAHFATTVRTIFNS